jgi:hypothetical protein
MSRLVRMAACWHRSPRPAAAPAATPPLCCHYSARVRKRRLKPGRYRATLVATDASGNRSQPGRVAFRVVRR